MAVDEQLPRIGHPCVLDAHPVGDRAVGAHVQREHRVAVGRGPVAHRNAVTGVLHLPAAVGLPVVEADAVGARAGQFQFPVRAGVLRPGVKTHPQRAMCAQAHAVGTLAWCEWQGRGPGLDLINAHLPTLVHPGHAALGQRHGLDAAIQHDGLARSAQRLRQRSGQGQPQQPDQQQPHGGAMARQKPVALMGGGHAPILSPASR